MILVLPNFLFLLISLDYLINGVSSRVTLQTHLSQKPSSKESESFVFPEIPSTVVDISLLGEVHVNITSLHLEQLHFLMSCFPKKETKSSPSKAKVVKNPLVPASKASDAKPGAKSWGSWTKGILGMGAQKFDGILGEMDMSEENKTKSELIGGPTGHIQLNFYSSAIFLHLKNIATDTYENREFLCLESRNLRLGAVIPSDRCIEQVTAIHCSILRLVLWDQVGNKPLIVISGPEDFSNFVSLENEMNDTESWSWRYHFSENDFLHILRQSHSGFKWNLETFRLDTTIPALPHQEKFEYISGVNFTFTNFKEVSSSTTKIAVFLGCVHVLAWMQLNQKPAFLQELFDFARMVSSFNSSHAKEESQPISDNSRSTCIDFALCELILSATVSNASSYYSWSPVSTLTARAYRINSTIHLGLTRDRNKIDFHIGSIEIFGLDSHFNVLPWRLKLCDYPPSLPTEIDNKYVLYLSNLQFSYEGSFMAFKNVFRFDGSSQQLSFNIEFVEIRLSSQATEFIMLTVSQLVHVLSSKEMPSLPSNFQLSTNPSWLTVSFKSLFCGFGSDFEQAKNCSSLTLNSLFASLDDTAVFEFSVLPEVDSFLSIRSSLFEHDARQILSLSISIGSSMVNISPSFLMFGASLSNVVSEFSNLRTIESKPAVEKSDSTKKMNSSEDSSIIIDLQCHELSFSLVCRTSGKFLKLALGKILFQNTLELCRNSKGIDLQLKISDVFISTHESTILDPVSISFALKHLESFHLSSVLVLNLSFITIRLDHSCSDILSEFSSRMNSSSSRSSKPLVPRPKTTKTPMLHLIQVDVRLDGIFIALAPFYLKFSWRDIGLASQVCFVQDHRASSHELSIQSLNFGWSLIQIGVSANDLQFDDRFLIANHGLESQVSFNEDNNLTSVSVLLNKVVARINLGFVWNLFLEAKTHMLPVLSVGKQKETLTERKTAQSQTWTLKNLSQRVVFSGSLSDLEASALDDSCNHGISILCDQVRLEPCCEEEESKEYRQGYANTQVFIDNFAISTENYSSSSVSFILSPLSACFALNVENHLADLSLSLSELNFELDQTSILTLRQVILAQFIEIQSNSSPGKKEIQSGSKKPSSLLVQLHLLLSGVSLSLTLPISASPDSSQSSFFLVKANAIDFKLEPTLDFEVSIGSLTGLVHYNSLQHQIFGHDAEGFLAALSTSDKLLINVVSGFFFTIPLSLILTLDQALALISNQEKEAKDRKEANNEISVLSPKDLSSSLSPNPKIPGDSQKRNSRQIKVVWPDFRIHVLNDLEESSVGVRLHWKSFFYLSNSMEQELLNLSLDGLSLAMTEQISTETRLIEPVFLEVAMGLDNFKSLSIDCDVIFVPLKLSILNKLHGLAKSVSRTQFQALKSEKRETRKQTSSLAKSLPQSPKIMQFEIAWPSEEKESVCIRFPELVSIVSLNLTDTVLTDLSLDLECWDEFSNTFVFLQSVQMHSRTSSVTLSKRVFAKAFRFSSMEEVARDSLAKFVSTLQTCVVSHSGSPVPLNLKLSIAGLILSLSDDSFTRVYDSIVSPEELICLSLSSLEVQCALVIGSSSARPGFVINAALAGLNLHFPAGENLCRQHILYCDGLALTICEPSMQAQYAFFLPFDLQGTQILCKALPIDLTISKAALCRIQYALNRFYETFGSTPSPQDGLSDSILLLSLLNHSGCNIWIKELGLSQAFQIIPEESRPWLLLGEDTSKFSLSLGQTEPWKTVHWHDVLQTRFVVLSRKDGSSTCLRISCTETRFPGKLPIREVRISSNLRIQNEIERGFAMTFFELKPFNVESNLICPGNHVFSVPLWSKGELRFEKKHFQRLKYGVSVWEDIQGNQSKLDDSYIKFVSSGGCFDIGDMTWVSVDVHYDGFEVFLTFCAPIRIVNFLPDRIMMKTLQSLESFVEFPLDPKEKVSLSRLSTKLPFGLQITYPDACFGKLELPCFPSKESLKAITLFDSSGIPCRDLLLHFESDNHTSHCQITSLAPMRIRNYLTQEIEVSLCLGTRKHVFSSPPGSDILIPLLHDDRSLVFTLSGSQSQPFDLLSEFFVVEIPCQDTSVQSFCVSVSFQSVSESMSHLKSLCTLEIRPFLILENLTNQTLFCEFSSCTIEVLSQSSYQEIKFPANEEELFVRFSIESPDVSERTWSSWFDLYVSPVQKKHLSSFGQNLYAFSSALNVGSIHVVIYQDKQPPFLLFNDLSESIKIKSNDAGADELDFGEGSYSLMC